MRFFRGRLEPLTADVRQHVVAVLAVLSMLGTVGVGAWFWQANTAQMRASDSRDQRLVVIEVQGKNLAVALDNQRAQFAVCVDAKPDTPGCYAPAVPAAKDVAPQIITGPAGAIGPGPTAAQITDAVTVYFAQHPAPKGKDGAPPDPAVIGAQIRAAVLVYLTGNPPANGLNGTDGTNGADSTVPGPAGPAGAGAVTDQQVTVAVASYCDAHDSCRGPAGGSGAAGQPPFSWVQTGPGPERTCVRDSPFDPNKPTYRCDVTPVVAPTETPTPTATPTG